MRDTGKTLILALGNPILSDDAVAHKVADHLAEHLNSAKYDIIKSSAATMDIIPKLTGYNRLVVIDAVQLGSAPVGTVHHFNLEDLASTVRKSSPHDINFATAFSMAEQWGYHIPANIRIYGIEAKELTKFSQNCTPEITKKLPEIVEHILSDLKEQ
ncbi:MAG: hydrogenase maturation protease [Phycisphaerales bacterium]|jgi:hydrogenase maturation protease